MKTKKKRIGLLILLAVIIISIIFCVWQNNSIVISKYEYVNSKIPVEFNDFKIVQISDLHNKKFGEHQEKLLKKVRSASPDIIVITGDLIDRRKYDLDTAMEFISGAVEIAPVYYVSGNHEAWSGKYSTIKDSLESKGVHVLDNSEFELSKGNSTISICGLSDPDFLTSEYKDGTDVSGTTKQLKSWADNENFKILLSHRPEIFDLYCENKMDLIFTGHAHGGQVRLPFVGGIVAPDQGVFPQYTSGSYRKNASEMFVSRGLGNSVVPIRVFNRPEIVVVTLKTTT